MVDISRFEKEARLMAVPLTARNLVATRNLMEKLFKGRDVREIFSIDDSVCGTDAYKITDFFQNESFFFIYYYKENAPSEDLPDGESFGVMPVSIARSDSDYSSMCFVLKKENKPIGIYFRELSVADEEKTIERYIVLN